MNKKIFDGMTISMAEFLYNYMGIEDSKIFIITHDDIKILLPDLKRYSICNLKKDLSLLYDGDIILVKDPKGNIVPYYNPLRYLDIIPTDLKEVEKPIKKNSKKEIKEIDNLTNYELKFEYLATKKNHKYKMCRILKKEILERGIKGAGKKKKIIEKLKGEIEND
ncbi:MAG: hypothetical protein PUC23_00010 [bacterium]|nr:hypothetical protein [bacterium]